MIAGTGFKVDVDRLGLLDAGLRQAIRRIKGSPRLNHRFETSVERFHVIGPASALSFGPLFRFVVGAHYTVRNPDPSFQGPSLMKPILFFFPGAGPPGEVAETLGRLFPEVEVVGIRYPEWRNLTDPERAMDQVLNGVERQVRARASDRPVLIVGYSLGATDRLGLCP